MENKSKQVVENFEKGYNCAQAVLLAYAKEFEMSEDMALKLASSFGGGMGRLREVCGAVSMMFAIAGLKYGYTSTDDDETKSKHYELIQKLAEEFKKKNGTIICRELLVLEEEISEPVPEKRTETYYQTRPCEMLLQDVCEIISNNL